MLLFQHGSSECILNAFPLFDYQLQNISEELISITFLLFFMLPYSRTKTQKIAKFSYNANLQYVTGI